MLRFTLAISAFAMMLSASASQPLRRTVTMTTEDGHTVSVVKRGGPDYSWWEAADGQCYELKTATAGARRVLSPIVVPASAIPVQGMRKAMSASTADGLGEYGVSGKGVVASIGAPVIPVIMVAFSDLDFLPGNDETKISRFLNEEGYKDEAHTAGSVADYFRHCSYGAFSPQFEVVAKVTLPKDYRYYGAHAGSANDAHRTEAVRDAVRMAEEQGVDFSKFASGDRTPLISILHAGPGEQEDWGDDAGDYLWAHFSQTSISGTTTKFASYLMTNETMRTFDNNGKVTDEIMTGIGTFCHEFGHALGLPDMYDVNGTTDGDGETPNYWDVMDYQFMYDGYCPMEYSIYERSMMGWVQVVDLNLDQEGKEWVLMPVGAATEGGNVAYRIVNPSNDKEYYLLENRQASPFYQTTYLGHGMQVWHILYDDKAWAGNVVNTKADRQRVHVIPADGQWQATNQITKKDAAGLRYTFPGDLFPGYTNCTVFDNGADNFFEGAFDTHIVNICEDADGTIRFYYVNDIEGIADITASANGSKAYDLSGRSVEGRQAHGIYIVDGKKMVK